MPRTRSASRSTRHAANSTTNTRRRNPPRRLIEEDGAQLNNSNDQLIVNPMERAEPSDNAAGATEQEGNSEAVTQVLLNISSRLATLEADEQNDRLQHVTPPARQDDENVLRLLEQISSRLSTLERARQHSPSRPVASPSTSGKLISSPIPVGACLRPAVIAAIKSGTFIDFNSFLDKEEPTPTLFTVDISGNAIFKPVESSSKSSLLPWNKWVRVWSIFQAMTCDLHPSQPSLPRAMAKHFDMVAQLMEEGKDWRAYDISFRRLISKGEAAWGDVHQESLQDARYHLTAQPHVMPQRFSNVLPTGAQRSNVPSPHCVKHHKYKSCAFTANTCRYNHRCFGCSGPHSFLDCPQRLQPFRSQLNNGYPTQNRGQGGRQVAPGTARRPVNQLGGPRPFRQ